MINTDKKYAEAKLKGSAEYPDIKGYARFSETKDGVLVSLWVSGLPLPENKCDRRIYAVHIHSGSFCTGNAEDPFADALGHYNPNSCPHPFHAGDMPPLFSAGGEAAMAFLTDSFTIGEIIGKTVILHEGMDDFKTQPSGNAGKKIACGVIKIT